MTRKAAKAVPNKVLRSVRKERGWTQQEVADRIGSPLALNVTRWECGTARPSAHYVERLCQLFGRSATELGLLADEEGHNGQEPRPSALPLWHVPLRRNPFFTGRDELLDQLHAQLSVQHSIAITQSYALKGLGGIGKTQVAIEYAYRFRQSYRAVFWVRAGNPESLFSDVVALAHLLELSECDERDQGKVAAAVKNWLACNPGWLLILDNVDDLELAQEMIPTGGEGYILLTTRMQATGTLAIGISVEKMDEQEGCLLVLRRAGLLSPTASLLQVDHVLLQETQTLVHVLDGLPLALDQVGAYIEETGCSLAQYLQLYHQRQHDLLNRRGASLSEYPYSVVSTWSLSFQQVEQANPTAADVLRLCAFLDPDAIPMTILTNDTAERGASLSDAVVDPLRLNEALQLLRRFSLMKRSPEEPTLSMHRLVQAVLRESLGAAARQQWAERAVRAVNAVFPEVDPAHWSECQAHLPHVQACSAWITHYQFMFPEVGRLLDGAGAYLSERGSYPQAEQFLQEALAIREQAVGPEHPDTATTLVHLASHLDRLGQWKRSEPLYLRALTIRERTAGLEHPDTATVLHNLAFCYLSLCDYAQAETLSQRALAIREHVLGPLHPDVGKTLNLLAILYEYQHKLEQAEKLVQRAITIFEQAFGSAHPSLANAILILACIYDLQGRHEQAEPLHLRHLSLQEQMLGPQHLRVAAALYYLAQCYCAQSKYEQATTTLERDLAILVQAVGPEHCDTALAYGSLGYVYYLQGHYEQAEPLITHAVTIQEQVLPAEHVETALDLYYLGLLREAQGRHEEAEALYRRALLIREHLLGDDHPETVTIRTQLSRLLPKGEEEVEQGQAYSF